MKTIKHTLCALAALCVASAALPWSAEAALVGISMPSNERGRWLDDGNEMKMGLEAAGHQTILAFAGANDVKLQQQQLDEMLDKGAQYLIISCVDNKSLGAQLNKAHQKGVKVIAYDRLLLDTEALDYYVSFDSVFVGKIMGRYIAGMLNLDESGEVPNIEFCQGSPVDQNATYVWEGSMAELQPYLDRQRLNCPSGETSLEQTNVMYWNRTKAYERMKKLIASQDYHPGKKRLDAVLAASDGIAAGVIDALREAGYDSSNMPIVVGQDCDKINVAMMIKGLQSMSVFKDTRELSLVAVSMVDALSKNLEVPLNDTEHYNNGKKVIPSYLLDPDIVTTESLKEVLFDTGYYDIEVFSDEEYLNKTVAAPEHK
ncbi:MAG: sugar-binding protein [Succinivibrio sp.]|nr:sugar-binding protein [Succinivibrio sp.]